MFFELFSALSDYGSLKKPQLFAMSINTRFSHNLVFFLFEDAPHAFSSISRRRRGLINCLDSPVDVHMQTFITVGL